MGHRGSSIKVKGASHIETKHVLSTCDVRLLIQICPLMCAFVCMYKCLCACVCMNTSVDACRHKSVYTASSTCVLVHVCLT